MARPISVTMRKLLKRFRPRREPELVKVSDRIGSEGRNQSIPRVVFQTAESRLVHPTHYKSISEFRALNSDLDFVFFDRHARDAHMEEKWGSHPIIDVYRRAIYGQMKADIFRYCVIYDQGGYYIDFNKGINGRITNLHPENAEGLVSYESNPELLFPEPEVAERLQNPFNLVMQWAFGFTREHPLLKRVINKIVEIAPYFESNSFKYPKSALLTLSATGLFTLVFREFAKTDGLAGITEAGVDFHGMGQFRLRGSKFLWKTGEHYSQHRDMPLLHDQAR